jgi:hypothetical protein
MRVPTALALLRRAALQRRTTERGYGPTTATDANERSWRIRRRLVRHRRRGRAGRPKSRARPGLTFQVLTGSGSHGRRQRARRLERRQQESRVGQIHRLGNSTEARTTRSCRCAWTVASGDRLGDLGCTRDEGDRINQQVHLGQIEHRNAGLDQRREARPWSSEVRYLIRTNAPSGWTGHCELFGAGA